MKKENYYKFCWFVSVLLVLGFAVNLIIEWVRYNSTLNSAPFYVFILVDGICFLLPAAIVFLIGIALKRKSGKNTP